MEAIGEEPAKTWKIVGIITLKW